MPEDHKPQDEAPGSWPPPPPGPGDGDAPGGQSPPWGQEQPGAGVQPDPGPPPWDQPAGAPPGQAGWGQADGAPPGQPGWGQPAGAPLGQAGWGQADGAPPGQAGWGQPAGAPPGQAGYGPPPRPGANGFAIAALICGLLALPLAVILLGGLVGVAAVVLGIVGLSRARTIGSGRGMAIGGIVSGVLAVVVAGAVLALSYTIITDPEFQELLEEELERQEQLLEEQRQD